MEELRNMVLIVAVSTVVIFFMYFIANHNTKANTDITQRYQIIAETGDVEALRDYVDEPGN